ncbi:MAG: hypothetical protein ABI053_00765 [Lacisediminihabitans sp.]
MTTALLAVGLGVSGVALTASAHNNVVSGAVACSTSGQGWTVTWTVTNDWDQDATIASTSPVLAGAAGTLIKAASNRNDSNTFNSKTFTQEVTTRPTSSGLTLAVTADWTDGTHRVNTATVAQSAFVTTCAPPKCVDTSAYKYTYDKSDNSGTIDVTGETCGKKLYVWATSWKYTLSSSIWPQTIDQVSKLVIDKAGHYTYKQTPTCGQGDIYSSWSDNINPASHSPLTGPSAWEKFLSGLSGITGTGGPTYMNQSLSCVSQLLPTASVALGTCVYPGGSSSTPVVFTFDNSKSNVDASFAVSGTNAYTKIVKAGQTATVNGPSLASNVQATYTITATAGNFTKTFADLTVTAGNCTPKVPTPVHRTVTTYNVDCSLLLTTTATTYTTDYVWNPNTSKYELGTEVAGTPVVSTKTTTLDELKTLGVDAPSCILTAEADPTDGVCAADGKTSVSGYITVDLKENVSYRIVGVGIDINPVTTAKTDVPAGDYKVTATATAPYTLSQSEWNLTVKANSCLTTLASWDANAYATNQVCNSDGSTANGYINVDFIAEPGFEDAVQYFVGTTRLTSAKTHMAAGTYTVTAKTADPADTIVGDSSWTLTIAPPSTACPQLKTLSFTGVDGGSMGGMLIVALLLLLGGAGVYTASRLRNRES